MLSFTTFLIVKRWLFKMGFPGRTKQTSWGTFILYSVIIVLGVCVLSWWVWSNVRDAINEPIPKETHKSLLLHPQKNGLVTDTATSFTSDVKKILKGDILRHDSDRKVKRVDTVNAYSNYTGRYQTQQSQEPYYTGK